MHSCHAFIVPQGFCADILGKGELVKVTSSSIIHDSSNCQAVRMKGEYRVEKKKSQIERSVQFSDVSRKSLG